MRNTIFTAAIGMMCGALFGTILGKNIDRRKVHKWCERMESKQIDMEIRLDLLEYNHLHEDNHLNIFFEDFED